MRQFLENFQNQKDPADPQKAAGASTSKSILVSDAQRDSLALSGSKNFQEILKGIKGINLAHLVSQDLKALEELDLSKLDEQVASLRKDS